MLANYGYTDGSGDYFLTIDTDQCDGCARCITACGENVLEMAKDDYGKLVAKVRDQVAPKLSYVCLGIERGCSRREKSCQTECELNAITLTW
ncbi:MAG: ferredoxin family protein [Chloroflexi bacterium]|nr:ferredoxin family protein [Chloroflexota bacterium]